MCIYNIMYRYNADSINTNVRLCLSAIQRLILTTTNSICFLFQRYHDWLEGEKSGSGEFLSSTIKVLENTAKIVDFFKNMEPIVGVDDARLSQMKSVLKFFNDWEDEAKKKVNELY
jgi:hypothetical protein